jgi:hypothetical protein
MSSKATGRPFAVEPWSLPSEAVSRSIGSLKNSTSASPQSTIGSTTHKGNG